MPLNFESQIRSQRNLLLSCKATLIGTQKYCFLFCLGLHFLLRWSPTCACACASTHVYAWFCLCLVVYAHLFVLQWYLCLVSACAGLRPTLDCGLTNGCGHEAQCCWSLSTWLVTFLRLCLCFCSVVLAHMSSTLR